VSSRDDYLATLATGRYDPSAAPPGVWAGPSGFTLTPPVDARRLAGLWGVQRPVAVSVDVHQTLWYLFDTGQELPHPSLRWIEVVPVRAGSLVLRARLTGRPPGPVPTTVAGASPAYDLLTVPGEVDVVEVRTATN
jgi:hypothetical protein